MANLSTSGRIFGIKAPITITLIYAMSLIYGFERLNFAKAISLFGLHPAGTGGQHALYQWLTYGFLHASPVHLALNLMLFWMFGRLLEIEWGSKIFLVVFIASLIFCGIGYTAVSELGGPLAARPVVGASGGIAAILVAHAIQHPKARVLLLFPPIPMYSWVAVLVLLALDVATALAGIMAIAHTIHYLGSLAGVVAGLTVRRSQRDASLQA